jgi:ferritin-like metal-binding protein YciE
MKKELLLALDASLQEHTKAPDVWDSRPLARRRPPKPSRCPQSPFSRCNAKKNKSAQRERSSNSPALLAAYIPTASERLKRSRKAMPVKTPKELCVAMLSELRHGAERSQKIYEELGQAAQGPEIKEALDARELVSSQIMNRLDECFKLIGEKPAKISQRLHDVFIEDFRRELNEIQGSVARKIFVLAKASHLAHLQVATYITLIAAADTLGHPGVGVLLESCLADKLAFMERTRGLIRAQIAEKVSTA